eukprot:Tamp_14009.p1 GENE.Tamp_14009~~Tamp_14009.p1  ORF type:complete len:367 (-),score=80.62 Tamp_14009:255-1355(-)
MWTMIGGGLGFKKENSSRPLSSVVPKEVQLISSAVEKFHPESNAVTLKNGESLTYDYLVVSAGLKVDWSKIQGLSEAIADPACPVSSIYDYNTAEKVDKIFKDVKEGNVLFTQPACPIKCGGAPQKVMWLQEAALRAAGVRDNVTVNFFTNLPTMFPVKKYGQVLDKMAADKDVKVHHTSNLIKIDKDKRIATFKNLETGAETTHTFDAMHVTPYMSPPEEIKVSPLADKAGFVDINKSTLQHTKYPNVFALGDSSNLPTSKTAAAISSQAPVLVSNLVHQMRAEPLTATYNGYTSCPIFVGDGKLVLAEFKYGGVVDETFPWDQSQPSRLAFHLKKDFFPVCYWNSYIKGTWFGRNAWFKPSTAY